MTIKLLRHYREGGIVSSSPVQDRGRGTATERRTTTFFIALTFHPRALIFFPLLSLFSLSPFFLPSSLSPASRRGVVAVVLRGEELLVIRRSQHVRAPGMHCFPGGAIEPDETESAAVCRELMEELALVARPVRLLWRNVTPWNVELAWWLAEIDANALPVANPSEVESFDWLTVAEIRGLSQLLPSNLEFLDAWENGSIAMR